jgi:fatty acid desaturase
MPTLSKKFWEPAGMIWHGAALLYASLGYIAGFAGLFSPAWPVNLLAILLLAHAMVIAAYLVHECAHNTIFRRNADNARLGRLLTWLCGASYGTYEDIRYKHFRHHVDNDDVVWFDYEKFFLGHPVVLRITRALEWCYVPAQELVMHGLLMVNAFVIPQRRAQRIRNVVVLLVRLGILGFLLLVAPRAALLYGVAYLLMLVVLRFMDSVQHDYGYHLTLYDKAPSPRRGDKAWEQEHTFSNPLSLRHEWVNWLVLNFGFHNAHHARPTTPWYRLPALHRELYGDAAERVIPFASQLRIYHRGRVERIVKWDDATEAVGAQPAEGFLQRARRGAVPGGNAASFLTSF